MIAKEIKEQYMGGLKGRNEVKVKVTVSIKTNP